MGHSSIVTPPPLIFLHIPKTAGSTLASLLERYYPADRAYRSAGAENLLELNKLSRERRARLLLIQGHVPLGLDRMFEQDFSYITLLRRPVERLQSEYSYIARRDDHPLHHATREVSFDEFLESGVLWSTDNCQTRVLAGAEYIEFGRCSREHLRQAKHNLESFFAFGLCERFDEFALRLHRLMSQRGYPFYQRKNVDRDNLWRERASLRTPRLLRELNELDAELYAWAATRLSEARHSAPQRLDALGFGAANFVYRWVGEPTVRQYHRWRIWLGRERRRLLALVRSRPSW